MSMLIIKYEAKCKHCYNCTLRHKRGKIKQSYCSAKSEWIRKNDMACDQFKLTEGKQ